MTSYKGALVVFNGEFLEPGTAATGLIAVGRAELDTDNASGGDGDVTVEARSGIFRWNNSGSDAVPATQVGSECFIEDDETVSATDDTGARSAAGFVYEVDADGVWVATGFPI
ncbi:MAG: hypothetical protein ACTSX8_00565 [Alphaproteobacteria bacterium]